MNVLALYDIHGNIEALDAVLADPAAQDAEAVVIGGDIVPGPFSSAVLGRLHALETTIHWLRGNGEREVAEALRAPAPDPANILLVTAAKTANDLDAKAIEELAALPMTVELDGVLYFHASPANDSEFLTRKSSPSRFEAALEGVQAQLAVAGHTHQQDDRRVGDVRFVNAGSVGLPYEGDGAARWVLVVDGEPELRTTELDSKAAGERMLERGWPDSRSVSGSMIDPVPAEVITDLFEGMATG